MSIGLLELFLDVWNVLMDSVCGMVPALPIAFTPKALPIKDHVVRAQANGKYWFYQANEVLKAKPR